MKFIGGSLHFDSVSAIDLVERYGSPLFVYEKAIVQRQIERVQRAFAGLPCRSAYALKANSNVSVLRLIAEAGFSFDAVSPGEIFLLQKAGVSGDRIWFTCSNVSDEDFRAVTDRDIIINLNSMGELDTLLRMKKSNRISIRINPEVGAGHHKDVVTGGYGVKFGFDVAELRDAIMIAADEGLTIVGLHAHIGSGVTDVAPLLSSAKVLLELAATIPSLRFVNFGGGISTPYKPDDKEFPIDEYGSALAMLAGDFLRQRNLTAIIEPGRYLVAESGTLLTRATTKRMSNGVEWIGCDTGFNHLARPSKYGAYHHIVNASRGSDADLRWSYAPSFDSTSAIVAGNLCESGDVFTRGDDGAEPRLIPPVKVGDVLAICDAGAYGFAMASHYNARLLPAEILVDGETVEMIRARQSMEELARGQ